MEQGSAALYTLRKFEATFLLVQGQWQSERSHFLKLEITLDDAIGEIKYRGMKHE